MRALIQYLSADGTRLLHGRYTEAVGCALFSAVAEATLLAAWTAYDSAPTSGLAQRYFIQALALAQAGGDRRRSAPPRPAHERSDQVRALGRHRRCRETRTPRLRGGPLPGHRRLPSRVLR